MPIKVEFATDTLAPKSLTAHYIALKVAYIMGLHV